MAAVRHGGGRVLDDPRPPAAGELGGCCINATLRDYARIGLFALADGVLADGTRVLPEGWMQASTAPSTGSDQYGYLWWLWPEGQYRALGIFGQTIAVYPDRNLVIATHGAAPTAVGGLPPPASRGVLRGPGGAPGRPRRGWMNLRTER